MLSEKNITKLKEHAKEHGGMGSKHMRVMRKEMEGGDSFAVAHKKAMAPEKPKRGKKPPARKRTPRPKSKAVSY